MTGTRTLARRLRRLLEQEARASEQARSAPIRTVDVRPRDDRRMACAQPAYVACLTPGRSCREVWCVIAETPAGLDDAIASLTARGEVPSGEWVQVEPVAPCPGGRDCTHLPRVIMEDGSVVSMAGLHAMEGGA